MVPLFGFPIAKIYHGLCSIEPDRSVITLLYEVGVGHPHCRLIANLTEYIYRRREQCRNSFGAGLVLLPEKSAGSTFEGHRAAS